MAAWLLLAACGGEAASAPASTPANTTAPPADPSFAPDRPEPPAPAPGADPWIGNIVPYPNARYLCYQHISAEHMHIMWQGYASPDPIEVVRAFYERHHGDATIAPNEPGFAVRASPSHVVTVTPVDAPHPTCDVDPAPTDRTYFVASASTE